MGNATRAFTATGRGPNGFAYSIAPTRWAPADGVPLPDRCTLCRGKQPVLRFTVSGT